MPIDMHNGDYVRLADILQPHVNLSVPVSFFVFPCSLVTVIHHPEVISQLHFGG